MDEKRPFHEPSSEEYARIAKGFDLAAGDLARRAGTWLRRIKWLVLAFLAALVLFYVGEDLWLRWSARSGRAAFGSVTVTRYYAIHKKSGKIEYDSDAAVPETCVNAAFPHFGLNPCWYLRRNQHPIIDM